MIVQIVIDDMLYFCNGADTLPFFLKIGWPVLWPLEYAFKMHATIQVRAFKCA